MMPFGADANATTAIARKGSAMSIAASCFHAGPDAMQAGVAFSVRHLLNEPIIRSPAAAGFRRAAAQTFADDRHAAATGALAIPDGLFVSTSRVVEHSQSTKCLAADINGPGHAGL